MLKSSCCLILAASQLIGAICLDVELLLGVGDQLPVVCVSLSGATARFQHVSYVLQAVRVASARCTREQRQDWPAAAAGVRRPGDERHCAGVGS